MKKGRVLFLLISLCVSGWVAYSYLFPRMNWKLFSVASGSDRGIALFEKGEYLKASQILAREVKQGEDTPAVLFYLGKALKEVGKKKGSEKYLQNLVKKYPSCPQLPEALFVLGEITNDSVLRTKRWLELLEKDYDGTWAGSVAVSLGDMLADSGKLFNARYAYSRALQGALSDSESQRIKNAIAEMNKVLLFSPTLTPDSVMYIVKSGDSLNRIAGKHNTTMGFIKMINRLQSDTLLPGQELKIIKTPVRILVERDTFKLTSFLGKHWIKEYTVGIGKEYATPIGSFKVVNKLINPDWFLPGQAPIPYGDDRNILGTRWIGLSKKGYGIHGTTRPESVGQAVTKGCVRMINADVEELFELVAVEAEVEIR